MKDKITENRRSFLRNGLLAASSFYIVPRHVLGKGFMAPSDKLNLAAIGAGGKGWSDINNAFNNGTENVVALCDVDLAQCKNAISKWPKAQVFSDFRDMFDRFGKDIDAVTISTPDHVHGVAAMAAMQLGKHVYVQKPLTHNIEEARKLTEAARKYKVVSQMGNQGASCPQQVLIKKWIDKGYLGTVDTVYVWTNRPVWPQGIPVPTEKPALPATMSAANWDNFIGPAAYTDYHPLYHPFKWRGWWNFGTGALGDMGCHLIDVPFRALELNYPTEVECSVGQVFMKDWNAEYIPEGCPPSSNVQIKFPASKNNKKDIKMIWTDGGIRPFHPDLIPAENDLGEPGSGNGVLMLGSKGILSCSIFGMHAKLYRNNGEVLTDPNFKTDNPFESLSEFGHQASWCAAIKDGFGSKKHKALTSSFDYSGPLTETVLMGNLAIRSYTLGKKRATANGYDFLGRKKLLWDGQAMKITNYEDANQFVGRVYREGWKM